MRALFIVLHAIIVQSPAVTLVANPQRVHQVCGPGAFDACTLFVAYRLDMQCSSAGGPAAMHGSVTFRPLIFAYDIRQIPHELMHVDDVRLFALDYVKESESLAFASPAECDEAARRLTAGFGEKMREFALRSNMLRHPSIYGRSTIPAADGR